MQAIITTYHGPTNYKPGRIYAKCEAGTIIMSWAHELSIDDNHKLAARKLCDKMSAKNHKLYGTPMGGAGDVWWTPFHTGTLHTGEHGGPHRNQGGHD